VAELSSSEMSNFGHSLTIHGPPRGDWTETQHREPSTLEILAGEESCVDTALLGVISLHGQEGDQFPKTDRAFCHLDVRRMLAAAAFSSSLRLEGFLRQRSHAITMLLCRSIPDQRGRIRAAVRRWNRTNVNSRKSRVVDSDRFPTPTLSRDGRGCDTVSSTREVSASSFIVSTSSAAPLATDNTNS
jgi:hypothetical protein